MSESALRIEPRAARVPLLERAALSVLERALARLEGGTLEVVVSFADPGNASGSETTTVSAGTVQENPAENATISLAGLSSGNAVEGQLVTVTVTEPDAPASGITYTWKVNGSTVKTGVDAAGNTYTPTETDEGQPSSVSVSFTDTHGNAESGLASITGGSPMISFRQLVPPSVDL